MRTAHSFALLAVFSSAIACNGPIPTTTTTHPNEYTTAALHGSGEEIKLPVSGEETPAVIWTPFPYRVDRGIVFLTGVDGGLVQPVDGIYSRIAIRARERGVSSVFVQYRQPGYLGNSVQDALAAADYLRARGVKQVAFVGWSFGGAVAINAAARSRDSVTVVNFAAQSLDTEAISSFGRQSILLIHSRDDENVPFESAGQILDEAPSTVRKRLIELEGFDHDLNGAGSQVDPQVFDWVDRELGLG